MENLRPRRSKVTSIADRSSDGGRFASSAERAYRGNRQGQKQKHIPKLASDSTSCSSGSTGEDSFPFELGWRSSQLAVGTPIKKLLAEEMVREIEPRRRSPSVIAKLMGLDGLPPQQPAHRQPEGISDNYFQKSRSVETEHRNSMSYERRSSRKDSRVQQEFKDVFEVYETSKGYSSRGTANPKLSDAEMAFVRQKFMDAKRLSTDERLQDSKEFHDALEVLESNKDLLLKFLQQPDSLFAKHLHDLLGVPQSRCGRIASMKSSEAQKYENIDLGFTSARERKHCSESPQKHRNSFPSHSDSRHAGHNPPKSSLSRSEVKIESAIHPTRIVVLKPNLGKVLNATKTSPCSPHASMLDGSKHTEFPSIRDREAESWGRKNVQDNYEHLRPKSRESTEVAKAITRKMRNKFSSNSVRLSSSGLKGYAGDESCCSMSENESANESEVMSVSSRHSFHISNHSRSSSSCSTESPVSREAKKRLSERWKMTHKSQEVGPVSRGSTLGEMLAVPDKETRAANLNATIGEAGFRDTFSTEDAPARWGGPLGISSRDGWKDGCINSLSRSKSLPSSSTAFASFKTSIRCETVHDDKYQMPKETVPQERHRTVTGHLDLREGGHKLSRSSNKISYSSHSLSREAIDISPETHTTENKDRTDFEENNQPQQNVAVFESPPRNAMDTSPVSANLVDVNASMPSETPDELLPELSSHMSVEGDSSGSHQDNLIPQEPSISPPNEQAVPSNHSVPGIESPASSKEAEQPSPVSVLEVPFTDDVSSSSECFESVSADLQGLRMQLQLLKLESEPHMEVSSDEEGDGSTACSDARGLCKDEESWESVYLADILTESGLNNAGPATFLAIWHTPESPMSPLLFEELEKKYYGQTSWPKPERKLLFDQVNSGLLEMFEQFTDLHPWARPANKRIGPKWIKSCNVTRCALEDVLRKLLANQEENASEDNLEKELQRDSLWMDFGDEIDVIGGEVERKLIDELVAEVVVM